MDSPLVRVILATLGGYLAIVLFLSAYEWLAAEYPKRPPPPTNTERIQHPYHHADAVRALQCFSRLTETEKAAIRQSLQQDLVDVQQWLALVRLSNYPILCIGELHEESTRDFLAEGFFAKIGIDVLALEATPQELKGLIKRLKAGRDYYPLLGADILRLLRAARDRNPDVRIYGIEETDRQKRRRPSRSNTRDQSIAENFWTRFVPGQRHVILFGSLHCANESNWLFQNLRARATVSVKDQMCNVQVLGEHQTGSLEAFVYFMDEIGMPKRDFVIPDTRSLHPLIYQWFQPLTRQTLRKFRSLVVFRT
jgi:hypothetical protein